MGILAKALSPPTAHALKKTDWFAEVKDRIDGAMLRSDLEAIDRWLDENDHTYPTYWRGRLNDMIELKREEIDADEVGSILRAKWDF